MRVRRCFGEHLGVPAEMGIYRGEVLTIMGALADIQAGMREILDILEDGDEAEEEQGDDEY